MGILLDVKSDTAMSGRKEHFCHREVMGETAYQDMQKLKRIADAHNITVLLVHHLRKQRDHDPLNILSGTTGIRGAADAVFVMERKERSQNTALMICTGRDVEHRELELRFSKERCVWDLVSDSA